ncbi:ABC transporter permease [Tessaracoccus antarcticus]|uniref:ABC transporter permease n=1 Tax=Tessaracoccus antarcticus TaxID=2479848 RepID=A0A3M0G0B5_9ACTN|nr:ABC transporter permease [Tessaracoccus antarcticus]RMB58400.1 ABC transporter permease [Tessaracoccus antarcticus]
MSTPVIVNNTAAGTPPPALRKVEARENRIQRLSTGVLLAVIGLMLVWGTFGTAGDAKIALSDAFDAVQLPTIVLPGAVTVALCAVLVLGAALAYLSGRFNKRAMTIAGVVGGVALLIGFITWAAAGSMAVFTMTNQLQGTLAVATPLVFGALCGALSERAGVVNIAIEGQFLTAAFAGAITGSLTKSLLAALIAAILAGMAMGALLALFTLKYFVDHVVLGVVINLLAAGLTGFLFHQLVGSDTAKYNAVPIMQRIPIPGLEKIPFLGPILFNQTALAYLAILMVPAVWFLLFKTKWGLRVRAVGEHPHAADTVGINVVATKFSSVVLGGAMAGLGGAYFTIGSTGAFRPDMTVGNGFIALAALIMGRWHPVWAALMAVFFGFVTQLGQTLNPLGSPIDSQFLLMLPYVATIIAVAGLVGRVRAPAADGEHFVKE